MGFALPAHVTAAAVRSYRTFSPLPAPLAFSALRRRGPAGLAVYSLWHFPWNPLWANPPGR